jgi:spore coat polysaccharide biosynthesis protein SpsF
MRVLDRVSRATLLDDVVLATPDLELADLAKANGYDSTIGSRDDVLARYLQAAGEHLADIIVRITADCPLIDPFLIDETLNALSFRDYASNVLYRTHPVGCDVEAFPFDVLQRIDRLTKRPQHREHVTFYIYEHPQLFDIVDVIGSTDRSDLRWCVDTEEDLAFVRTVYARFGNVLDHKELITLLEGDHGKAKPMAVAS